MASNFARSITSEIFQLTAHQGQMIFHVHKDILTSQSQVFRAASTGIWKESTERKIDLEDWDGETVGRLVEFLYTGNYQYPNPEQISPGQQTSEEGFFQVETLQVGQETIQPQQKSPESRQYTSRPLTPLSKCLHMSLPQDQDSPETDAAKLEKFDPSCYDYKEALLSHAKVYVLAHYKSIDSLQTLALQRLLMTLSRINPINPHSHIALNIVDLVSYVYSNTDNPANSEEPLRRLISQFVALNFSALQTKEEVMELMGEGGDFVKDVMSKIGRVLRALAVNPDIRFVSNIQIKYGGPGVPEISSQRVQELKGRNNNINWKCGSVEVWLIPEYTTVSEDACTNLHLVSSRSSDCTKVDIAPESGSMYYYLVPIKEKAVKAKITELTLLRETKRVDNIASVGSGEYDGMTDNLIENRGPNEYLYVIWKSVIP